MMKLLEENIVAKHICNLRVQRFLWWDIKRKITIFINNILKFCKTKIFCSSKDTIKRMKRQAQFGREFCKAHIWPLAQLLFIPKILIDFLVSMVITFKYWWFYGILILKCFSNLWFVFSIFFTVSLIFIIFSSPSVYLKGSDFFSMLL